MEQIQKHFEEIDIAPWKLRFKVPRILWTQPAPAAPERGLLASNQSGVVQLYAWNPQSNEIRQLTQRPSGVRLGKLSPNGEYVIYLEDEGGNEIGHYVRVPYEGGKPLDITPHLAPYASFDLTLGRGGKTLGLVAADAEGFHLYVVDGINRKQPGEPRKLFDSQALVMGLTLDRAGKTAVIGSSERFGTQHLSLIAFDTTRGERLAELWDRPEDSLTPVMFSPISEDGWLLATTNRTGYTRPLLWNPRSGSRIDFDLPDLPGEVDPVDWSPDGKRILLSHMHAAVQQLYLLEIATGRLSLLEHPRGTYAYGGGTSLYFVSETEILALWQDSTHPGQVIALDAHTGQQVRSLLAPGPVPAGCAWRSVSFSSSDGQEIQGWLATPPGRGPFPTILETHGGPQGVTTDLFSAASQAWLDHGFGFLSINYRGSITFGKEFEEKIWLDLGNWEVEDMEAAYHYLVEQAIAHPDQVFLTGWSYGGYLTLLGLGKKPALWAGGMAGIAIADWAVQYEDSAETLRGYQRSLFGGPPEAQPDLYQRASPITYVENIKVPVLVIQGRNDTRCPSRPMEMYEAKMRGLGKPIQVEWFEAGHGSLKVEESIHHMQMMIDFAQNVIAKNKNQ